jgi:hypothetical protein
METFFQILIVLINLFCFGYLLYVIRGLFKYGKKVFEYRNKAAVIVIVVLTIAQIQNSNEEKTHNDFEIILDGIPFNAT